MPLNRAGQQPPWASRLAGLQPEVYDFQIYANAPVGRTVGRIRTEGARLLRSRRGTKTLFNINPASGRITVARSLSGAADKVFELRVEAGDKSARPFVATVTISVLPPTPCLDGIAVVNPDRNPW